MAITLNNTAVPQPDNTGVKEELMQIYHDRMRVNGSLQRNFFGVKKQVTLTWSRLVPSDYQQLMGFFATGNTVTYNNPLSAYSGGSMSFTGLPMHAEDVYLPGATLLRSLTVTLREV